MLKIFFCSIVAWFRTRLWEIAGALLILFVVAINQFPEGYIVLGGDVLQPVNMGEQYAHFYYEWFGRVSIFYGIFYLLDIFGVTETGQLSWYLGIFLFGAYLSFLWFSLLLFPRAPRWVSTLTALFYAMNVYTLYIFTSTWGFTHYQILYVFIPALTGLYITALHTLENRRLLIFLLVTFFASMGFGNPAFALSLGIYFFFLTVFLLLFRFIEAGKRVFKKIAVLAVGAFLLNAYWILPIFPQMRAGIQEVSSSTDINLSESLQKTSNAISDTVRLMQTREQKKYFPQNFPYPSFSWMKEYLLILAYLPFFLVLFGLIQRKEREQKRLYFIFFGMFVVFIALVARVRFPFDTVNNFLFQLPGLNVLRGHDKLAIFTPFLLGALLLMVLLVQEGRKYSKVFFGIFFLAVFLLALPFYAGGIQTRMSYILHNQKKKDFQEAKYSSLVKVPEPYYAVKKIFHEDDGDYKISMLPYSPGSSVGRVNLPLWKVNGPHVAHSFYNKKYVELTNPYIPGWKFAEDFENSLENPQWIADLYGLLGVKYIFYHKDAKPKSIELMESARFSFEKNNTVRLKWDNDWFTLYSIDEKKVFPYVYASKNGLSLESKSDGLSEKIDVFRSGMSALPYQRENEKKIIVFPTALSSDGSIFLNEKYDPLWKAEYISSQGTRRALLRNNDIKFANAWKIDQNFPENGKIEIYHSPLRLLSMGKYVSGMALLFVFLGIVYFRKRRLANL